MPYFYDLFAGGVVLARRGAPSKGFRRINFPRFRSSGSLTKTEMSICEKIQERYEVSMNEIIQDFLPFLKLLAGVSRRNLKAISDWLELDAREKKRLTK